MEQNCKSCNAGLAHRTMSVAWSRVQCSGGVGSLRAYDRQMITHFTDTLLSCSALPLFLAEEFRCQAQICAKVP